MSILISQMISKSTLKFHLWKYWQKCVFSNFVWQQWTRTKIDPNLIKINVDAYLSNGYLNPLSKLNSEKVEKVAYFKPWFEQPWTSTKIAPNLIKISVHAYLSNMYRNPLSKLNSEKVNKSTFLQPWLNQPWMRAKLAPNIIKIGLISQMGTYHFQNSILSKSTNVHILTLCLNNLEKRKK